MKFRIFSLLVYATVVGVTLSACTKEERLFDSPPKSFSYYREKANWTETAQVAKVCENFINGNLSTRSATGKKNWGETQDGVNCQNARKADAYNYLDQRQQKMIDDSNAYSLPQGTQKKP